MDKKTCFKCGVEKPLSEYYKHKCMSDGHLNKCKSCAKSDARKHRLDNLEKVKAYDRSRGSLPHRVDARKKYAKTEAGKLAFSRAGKKYVDRYPNKYKAHYAVSNAIRDGKLDRPDRCSICGVECKPHAHHWSYEECNWLDVEWVCLHCHVDIHHKFE